jgi:hypothetical protein
MRLRSIRSGSVERRLLLLVLCAPLLGLVGVLVAEVVPDGRIAYHLLRAEQTGVITPVERPTSVLGIRADQFTECTAFSVGLGDHPDEGFVSNTLLSPAYVGCQRLEARLRRLEVTDTLPPGTPYLRYWHGYAVLTRPALGLTGVAGTRWIAFALLVLTAGGMAVSVGRAFGTLPAVLLVGPAALTTDLIMGGVAATTAIGMSSAWLGGWVCFSAVGRWPEWKIAGLTAAIAGGISAYVDLMTTTPGAFALAVIGATLGFLAAGVDPAVRRAWQITGAAAVGWMVGLVWMWVSKWAIAAAVLGAGEVVDNVRSQIRFRLSGDYEGVSPSRVRGLTENLDAWWRQPLTPWVVVAVAGAVVVALVRLRRRHGVVARIAGSCALVAAPVLGWYVALNNHSQIHSWLVYRSLPVAFGGLSAVVLAAATTAPVSLRAAAPP